MTLKSFRERSPILIGILSILALIAATTFAFYVDRIPFLKRAYVVKAEFADAAGLAPDNQVRVAGIKVGSVKDVRLAGDRVLATLEIENGTRISRQATAEIKLATLLGTKFVDVRANGGEPYMQDGDEIPLARTKVPYEIYQATTQGAQLLQGIDSKALNDMLRELAKVTKATRTEIGSALAGLNELGAGLNSRRDELKSLLRGANDLTALLSDEGDEIVALIDSSNEVLGSLARKREEVQSVLEATRSMSAEVTRLLGQNRASIDKILRRLHRALRVLEANVQDLDMALEYVGPTSRYLAGLTRQGRWVDIYICALVTTAQCEPEAAR